MSDVLFETIPAKDGRLLGLVTLNAPATLNSLSLEMIDLLTPQLSAWQNDDAIVMVIFQSSSDKAFSAGGDIQALYQSMLAHPGGPNPYAEAFFEREYRLDYLIHTYSKPTLVWAHGIVMGGGLGIMGGCSHRIGTQTTRLALPEITIGLFPDAGATWFLSQMPRHWAYFMAWTGCHLNAADGRLVGLIDYLIDNRQQAQVLERLLAESWSADGEINKQRLDQILQRAEAPAAEFPPSQLAPLEARVAAMITQVLATEDPVSAFSAAVDTAAVDTAAVDTAAVDTAAVDSFANNTFLVRAANGIKRGSPTTAHIIHEQLKRAKGMSLKQTFELELVIAVQCSRHPDFTEGVRALLIDKDNKPQWQYGGVEAVPVEWLQAHFTPPWKTNPLADLPNR